jgi:hypothetical protein
VHIEGSIPLFLTGAALNLFATNTLRIFLATIARSMPHFDTLLILALFALQMLSGGMTPRESMPGFVQKRHARCAHHPLCPVPKPSRRTGKNNGSNPGEPRGGRLVAQRDMRNGGSGEQISKPDKGLARIAHT